MSSRYTVTKIESNSIGVEGPDDEGDIAFYGFEEDAQTMIYFPAWAAEELIPHLQACVDRAKEVGVGQKPTPGLAVVRNAPILPPGAKT